MYRIQNHLMNLLLNVDSNPNMFPNWQHLTRKHIITFNSVHMFCSIQHQNKQSTQQSNHKKESFDPPMQSSLEAAKTYLPITSLLLSLRLLPALSSLISTSAFEESSMQIKKMLNLCRDAFRRNAPHRPEHSPKISTHKIIFDEWLRIRRLYQLHVGNWICELIRTELNHKAKNRVCSALVTGFPIPCEK